MKYGKPCIASDVSSMPEIVAKAGILVDPFSVSAITDALDHLIKEQTERSKWPSMPDAKLNAFLGRRRQQDCMRSFLSYVEQFYITLNTNRFLHLLSNP